MKAKNNTTNAMKQIEKKNRKGMWITLWIILGLMLVLVIFEMIPPKSVVDENSFINGEDTLPMIAVQCGGGINNPENTLLAYRMAVNKYGIQICKTDLWMTRDGHLVYSYDASINRLACPEGAEQVTISEHTLAELRTYNMGYNFKDPVSGEYIYRDAAEEEQLALGLKILEFPELLEEFYDKKKDFKFIVEIKNDGEMGYKAAEIIDKTLTEHFPAYKNNLVVGTAHPAVEAYLQENHPTLFRGASTSDAKKFIFTQMFGINLFDTADFVCLQIPMKYMIAGIPLDLTWRTYISRAHRRNIAVQYGVINDEDDMRFLIEKGADAIITDNPMLLKQVLDEYQ